MTAGNDGDRYLILSIDGGGIRGIIPAMLLQDLERNAGLRLKDVALFAGTSAGSLTALGLAAGMTIDKIASVYADPNNSRRIFTPYDGSADSHRWGCLGILMALVQRLVRGRQTGMLGTLNHLLNPRYTSRGFRELIVELAPAVKLRDLGPKVYAPSLVLDSSEGGRATWRATAFHNFPGRANTGGFDGHRDALLVDAVVASSSAPVDFPPEMYDGKLYVDGGMIARNPSALALTAAMGAGLVGNGGAPLERVRMLSLGTGESTTVYPPLDVALPPPFGALGWLWPTARGRKGETPAVPLASALSDAVVEMANYQSGILLPEGTYRRVDLDLGNSQIALDDAAAIPELQRLTTKYMESSEWEQVRHWVREQFRK